MRLDEGLALVRQRAGEDRYLTVLVTTNGGPGADPDVAVVNAGVLPHPVTAAPVVAFVGRRGRKLENLRRWGRATLVFRAGWEWVAVRGPAELAGPDDAHPGIDAERLRVLMRDIYAAAGGHHPDLDAYDRVMAAERRCAVLVIPERIWMNPPSTAHVEPSEAT
ncbi:MAG: pyridoxamine 5'-phosphate oxidase [Egibacteraceae bacterium]